MTRTQVEQLIEAILALREDATDQTASEAVGAFPTLKADGGLIAAGTRINWNGKIMRAAVDLWDTAELAPDVAPTLWEEIEYREGIRIIPEVITAGKAFSYGELGWWGDVVYRSILPGEKTNVYTPEQYPAGWEAAEE